MPVAIVADEHPDAAGLAVAAHGQLDWPGRERGLAQRPGDRGQLGSGPAAEERERDVQVLPRDDAALDVPLGPGGDPLDRSVGEPERAEEPEPSIGSDATAVRVARVYQLWVKRRRTRWSAATAARERIASRSDGYEKSITRAPSGVSAAT